MNLRTFLELCGTRAVLSIAPEGKMAIELLAKYHKNIPDSMTLTGDLMLSLLDELPPAINDNLSKTELNDGKDIVQYRNELQSLLETKDVWGKRIRLFLSVGMATLLAGMCIAHTAAMLWVAMYKHELPGWEVLMIVYGIPGMVVWHFFGVMTQERRDFLAAAIGRTPQAGMLGGMLSSMGSGGIRRRRQDYDDGEYSPRPPQNSGSNLPPPPPV